MQVTTNTEIQTLHNRAKPNPTKAVMSTFDVYGDDNKGSFTSEIERIKSLLKKCRKLGQDRLFKEIAACAGEALEMIAEVAHSQHGQDSTISAKASALGYQGYALFHLNRSSDAMSPLRLSLELFQQLSKKSPLQQREEKAVLTTLDSCYKLHPSLAPLPKLLKYPRTVHLFDSGGTATTNDDLVLPDMSSIVGVLSRHDNASVTIEEKIDGSNLGISLCPYSQKLMVQNRSHYISQGDHAQYSRITEWLEVHREELYNILAPSPRNSTKQCSRRILYGEWMAARHSVPYQKLPGLFVAFDLYDEECGKFLSRRKFHTVMKGTSIPVNPVVPHDPLIFTDDIHPTQLGERIRALLIELLDSKSLFQGDGGTVEGVVLRIDDSEFLLDKYKVVRPDFVQGCSDGQHWSRRKIEAQRVDHEFAQMYLKTCYPLADEKQGENRK